MDLIIIIITACYFFLFLIDWECLLQAYLVTLKIRYNKIAFY